MMMMIMMMMMMMMYDDDDDKMNKQGTQQMINGLIQFITIETPIKLKLV